MYYSKDTLVHISVCQLYESDKVYVPSASSKQETVKRDYKALWT